MSQVVINGFDYDRILLNYYSIQELKSISSEEDSCTYLYAHISHPTNEEGTSFVIEGKVYTSKKSKELLWYAKVNSKGDTLFTKILSDIPEFRSIYGASVKKGIVYFIVSNTYIFGDKTSDGCLLISYNHKTDKIVSQQIYEVPFDSDCFFIKDNNGFYLIVNDTPHLCLPPEYNIYLLQLNNSGKIIKKTLLNKTICMRGEYSPTLVHVDKKKKLFYILDADLLKSNNCVKNSCSLNLFDVFENKTISYTSYKRYISFFDLNTTKKLKRISFPCNQNIVSFLNDTEYVYSNTYNSIANKINFTYENLKRKYSQTLEINTFSWHTIKVIGQDMFVFGFSADTVNIKRIKNKTLLYDKTCIFSNYKAQYGNNITPVFIDDKIRYYYIRQADNSKKEISYFDELR